MSQHKAGIIIQARTGSVSLPGKMTLPFYNGLNLLELMINDFGNVAGDVPFVVATTTLADDDIIERICEQNNVAFFRGSSSDVLARFIGAAHQFGFDSLVRVCADNPFFDLTSTLKLASFQMETGVDYTGFSMNGIPSIKTHIGLWGEAVSLSALEKAAGLTNEPLYREHVTNYVYSNPEIFNIHLMEAPFALGNRNDLRFTLDTNEDFLLHQQLYSKLAEAGSLNNYGQLVGIVDDNPVYRQRMFEQILKNTK